MSERLESRAGTALLWQAASLAGSKLIFLGRMLLLAWLLTAEDFGLMAIAVVGVELMLTFTEFGLVPALVQQPAVDARQYDVAWTVGLLRALAVAAVLVVAAPGVAAFFADDRAVPLLRAMAIRPALEAAASIRVAVLTRELRFRELAWLNLADGIVNAAVSVGLAPSLGVWALVLGSLAGKGTYLVVSYAVAPWRPRLAFDTASAGPLLHFGRWLFGVGLVSFVGRSLLQAAIARRAGTAELGVYVLAARLAFLPWEVSSGVVAKVAFPLYVQLRATPERAAATFRLAFTALAAMLVPATVLLIVLAPVIASDVLGPGWSATSTPIRVLAVAGLIGIFAEAVVPLFHAFGRPGRQFAMEVAQSLVLVAAAWWLAGSLGAVGAALAWVVAAVAAQGVGVVLARGLLRDPFTGLLAPLAAVAAAALAGAALAAALVNLLPGVAGVIATLALVGAFVALIELALDRWLRLGLLAEARRYFPRMAGKVDARFRTAGTGCP